MPDEFTGFLRIFHANTAITRPLKLYINDYLVDNSFNLKDFTDYVECVIGCYNISLKDTNDNTLYTTSVTINKDNVSTLVIYGDANIVKTALLVDSLEDDYDSKLATIRYANFVNDEVAFDITVNNKQVVTALGSDQVSYYMYEKVGNNSLVAKSTKTGKTLLQVPKMQLKPDYVYTGYLIGDIDGKLELIIPLEGVTYIKK